LEVIGDVVDDEHKVWQLHISARETSDSVLTPVIDLAWLPYLELITAHHHALLKDTAPKAFTPKMHFTDAHIRATKISVDDAVCDNASTF